MASLSYDEKNALRYTAGYVTRALRNNFKRSSSPLNQQLIGYLDEISSRKHELSGGMKEESEDWFAVVGRGGLTHIRNMMFGLFVSMELEVRQFFHLHPLQLRKTILSH